MKRLALPSFDALLNLGFFYLGRFVGRLRGT
jgi:hypothetical protein